MNYSLFKWSRKTCSGHDSNAAILQASREYGLDPVIYLCVTVPVVAAPLSCHRQLPEDSLSYSFFIFGGVYTAWV